MYIIILKNTEKNLDFFDKIKVSIFKIHFYSQKSGALSVANKAYILEQGVVTLEGNAKDLLKDERIQEAYLGKKH